MKSLPLIKLKIINERDRKNYKLLEVPSNMTLYKFAEIIIKSFGFYFDHAFGFYNNIENPYKSKEMYELFTDMEDVEHTPNAKGVKKFYFVSDLFENNTQMLFLFDYGDCWHFILELLDDSEKVYSIPKNYYKIYESFGEDPQQYPDID